MVQVKMSDLCLELICLATILVISYVMVHLAGFTCSAAAFHYIGPPTSGANPLTPERVSKTPGLDHLFHRMFLFIGNARKQQGSLLLFHISYDKIH